MSTKQLYRSLSWTAALACALPVFIVSGAWASPAAVPFTILHTNDMHSHFRSEKSPLHLGGVARLRTVIQAARAANPESVLVDGGDWSEGQIYYVEGGGAESLRMMDLLGYDVAVVGNHDWLNGPGRLLDAVHGANARLKLVGANFVLNGFGRAAEFNAAITPYSIHIVHGLKVAFVGLVNFDPVYAGFLAPVTSVDPSPVAERIAQDLKARRLADIVVGISHNSIDSNRQILQAAPDLDLIVGAHDHQLLRHAVTVTRPGHPDAWIVEAGRWGQYLGELKLSFTPGEGSAPSTLQLDSYQVRQVDRNIVENPEVLQRVDALEARIEGSRNPITHEAMGPIFHDHVSDCETEINGDGLENMIGDFVTDAYRHTTGADVAIDQNRFIYGGFEPGAINSADVFNALAPIYNFTTGKAWTLQTFTMTGSMASSLFRLLYTWRKITSTGGLSLSGLQVMYDPLTQHDSLSARDIFGGFLGTNSSPVHSLTINGRPIDPNASYKFAASSGIVAAIQIINDRYYNIITLHDLVDTGVEDWRVVRDYARSMKPLTAAKIAYGNRIQTWQADLGIVPGSLQWSPLQTLDDGTIVARVELTVRNFGGNPSPATGATVDIASNSHGYDATVDAYWVNRGAAQPVPALQPGQSQHLVWGRVPLPTDRGVYPVSAFIHTSGETNGSNDGMTRYFVP